MCCTEIGKLPTGWVSQPWKELQPYHTTLQKIYYKNIVFIKGPLHTGFNSVSLSFYRQRHYVYLSLDLLDVLLYDVAPPLFHPLNKNFR